MTKPIRMVFHDPVYGELTEHEHILKQAFEWQATYIQEHPPVNGVSVPEPIYTLVCDLLGLLPFKEAQKARLKFTPPPPHKESPDA